MVTGEIKEGIFKTKVSGGLKNKWLLQHHFINRISSVARTLWKHQSNLGLLKSFYMTQTLWIFFFLFLGTKPETIIQEVFVFLLADSCPQVKTLFRVGSYPTVSKYILFKTNLFSFPLTVSYTFTSTKWKRLTQWPECTRTHITWCRTIILFTLCLQRNVKKRHGSERSCKYPQKGIFLLCSYCGST